MMNMEFISFKSHIDAKLSKIYDNFFLFPFKYFNESEIHYWFTDLQNKLRKEDRRHFDMNIIREFPTEMKYKKNNQGQLIIDQNGRSGHIDVVISYKDQFKIGYEFFFGKETPDKQIEWGEDKYFLRKRSLSPNQTLLHTNNDILKLRNEKKMNYCYILMFVASLHESKDERKKFICHKRELIINGLKKIQKDLPDNIKIYYFEKGYVDNFNDGEYYLCSISNNPREDNFYERGDGIV